MGLDAVEVVIAIEEAFDISISDEEASEVRTVGQLKGLVLRLLSIKNNSVCWSQRAFHRLRKSSRDLFGIERRKFHPELALREFIPLEDRKQRWGQLRDNVGVLAWPKLVWPRNVDLSVKWLIALTYSVLIILGAALGGVWLAFLFAAFGALLLGGLYYVLERALRPMETAFPKHCLTVANLVPYVAAGDPALSKNTSVEFSEPQVSFLVSKILCEQLGLKGSDFNDDSELVRDLGMD